MAAKKHFGRLTAPDLVREAHPGTQYVYGVQVKTSTEEVAA